MFPVRVGLRACPPDVTAWVEAGGHSGIVHAGLSDVTYVDLMLPETSETGAPDEFGPDLAALQDLAAACATPVVSVSPGWGDLEVREPGQDEREIEREDAEALLGQVGLEELLVPDLRFRPPFGRQVFVVTTPSEDNWAIARAVLQTELSVVHLDAQSVVVTPHDNLLPVAHGIVATGKESGLIIGQYADSWTLDAFRGGKVRTTHLRVGGTQIVGWENSEPEDADEFAEPTADARTLADCVGAPAAQANMTLIRALLRRGPHTDSPSQLIDLLGLGEAGALAVEVLGGADLRDDPRADTTEPSGSPWKDFLTLVAGGPLQADRVPWVSMVYAAWIILLLPLAGENIADWVGGRADGWDVAQLVGCAISIPASLVGLGRLLAWLRLRRP
ncbi:hypothetical protein V6K52_10895 [Knoellia sp. S7-12]|uniref:hypothetical protein n=1 Tax=Knoellia sp. S7-12 TaxID=3126698 RepID=UPI0033675FA8